MKVMEIEKKEQCRKCGRSFNFKAKSCCGVLLCLMMFFTFQLMNFNTISMNYDKNDEFTLLPLPSLAGYLPRDEYIARSNYADNYIQWSFYTFNNPCVIDVWLVESSEWSLFKSGFTAGGYLLTTASSGSGTPSVPFGDTWHIVFFNNRIGATDTFINYDVSFYGDSRPASINMNSPYSGASYRAGTSCEIKWSSINAGSNVKIDLFKGGSINSTIISSTANDGSYYWTIPSDISPDTDYQVKVSSLSTAAEDLSSYFQIRDPNIFTFIYPNYTSSLSMGNHYDILFDNSEYVHDINVSLYHNDEFVNYIATERNNWGHYYQGVCPWRIPTNLIPSNNYSIFVCDSQDANVKVISDKFEITEFRDATFLNPKETTQIAPNSNFTITWNSTGPIISVNLLLRYGPHYVDRTLNLELTIASNILNNGSFKWEVPDLPTRDEYYIMLEVVGDPGAFAFSDDFYIGPPIPSSPGIPGYDLLTVLIIISFISIISIFWRKRTLQKIS